MRKIIFHLETGSCGSEAIECGLFSDDVTDEELDDEGWERAVQNAESYGIYPAGDLEGFTDDELAEIDTEEYSYNIEGWWEDYDPDKHDMLVPGGGDWVWQ